MKSEVRAMKSEVRGMKNELLSMNMGKSRKLQINAELSFVFDPLSWFLVPGSVISCQLSEV